HAGPGGADHAVWPARALIRARPEARLADDAAEDAALQLDGVRILQRHRSRIGLAVLGIVDLSLPLIGARRLHPEHDLDADQRPAALGRIGIVLVGLRLAGRRVDRLLERD